MTAARRMLTTKGTRVRLDAASWACCVEEVASTARMAAWLPEQLGQPLTEAARTRLLPDIAHARAILPVVVAIGVHEGWITRDDAIAILGSDRWPEGPDRVHLPGFAYPGSSLGMWGSPVHCDWHALARLHGVDPDAWMSVAGDHASLRVAWVDPSYPGRLAVRAVGAMTSHTIDRFDTHEAMLDSDARTPYDVVILRAADSLSTMAVRETLRARGHARAVALRSGCGCSDGIERAHGVALLRFDAFFRKDPDDWRLVSLWLDDLAAHPAPVGSREVIPPPGAGRWVSYDSRTHHPTCPRRYKVDIGTLVGAVAACRELIELEPADPDLPDALASARLMLSDLTREAVDGGVISEADAAALRGDSLASARAIHQVIPRDCTCSSER